MPSPIARLLAQSTAAWELDAERLITHRPIIVALPTGSHTADAQIDLERDDRLRDGQYPGQALDKDEVKAAAGDRGKVIQLDEFVRAAGIDPVFYGKTYYVGSRDDEDAFRLLREALRKTKRAGIGRFSFHDREYLVSVRAGEDGVLLLDTLRFHDEVVSGDDLELGGRARRPAPGEVQMAGKLVETLAQKFDPADDADTYRDAVLDLIKRTAKGEEIDLVAEEEPEHGDDLAAALEASLAGAGR